ncbi:hypothetical protein K458DRAFT_399633 [Lentithecium fluviatile CBS 122367]|uniref:Uncharacterized protein n=1 Tax=Lentithecium fluviatile CBS 122367 TaxID=1168545 RepID=A0A6G1JIB5_9PLEO|nr:hypothetical protein K458DRAFT_399633 [Lentithecium fluviatile CBS 122367]
MKRNGIASEIRRRVALTASKQRTIAEPHSRRPAIRLQILETPSSLCKAASAHREGMHDNELPRRLRASQSSPDALPWNVVNQRVDFRGMSRGAETSTAIVSPQRASCGRGGRREKQIGTTLLPALLPAWGSW